MFNKEQNRLIAYGYNYLKDSDIPRDELQKYKALKKKFKREKNNDPNQT